MKVRRQGTIEFAQSRTDTAIVTWFESSNVLLAVLAAYSGVAHLLVVHEHLAAWWGYGLFFLAVGVFQLSLLVPIVRHPTALIAVIGVVVNTIVLLIYVDSRTVGVPIGPEHTGHRLERAGPLDLTVAAAELGVIALLVARLEHRTRQLVIDGLLVVGLALWLLVLFA